MYDHHNEPHLDNQRTFGSRPLPNLLRLRYSYLPNGSTVYPEWWGATTTGDNATALQAAFTAAAHGKVKLTRQYTSASAITVDHYTIVEGNGNDTGIIFTHTGDGLTSTWPINSSTAAEILIKDLYLYNTNASNTGGAIVDVGGTYFKVERCKIQGFKYGIILDQTELFRIRDNHFVGQMSDSNTGGGIWIVNGDDHTAGANQNYTNQGIIEGNQFNTGTGTWNIIDDGGVNHTIIGNNFNGGLVGVRVAGVYGLNISSNEFEGHQGSVFFSNTTLAGTAVQDSQAVTFNANVSDEASASYGLSVDYVHGLEVRGNQFGQMAHGVLLANTTSNRATGISMSGNTKTVTGAYKVATGFIGGSVVPFSRVDISRQRPMTYVETAQAGTGSIQVTPATMEFIHIGSRLYAINNDNTNGETITVTACDATTFTATFASTKAADYLIMGVNSQNNTGTLTLTANSATTTVPNSMVTATSKILITPTSANAAADQGSATGVWVSARSAGTSFTLTHPNNANADKTFDYEIKD